MSFALIFFLAFTVLVSGVLIAVTPFLVRGNEVFTVTVPESAQNDPRFMAFRKSYVTKVMLLSVVCTVVTVASFFVAGGGDDGGLMCSIVMTAAILVLGAASFAMMLHYRNKVQEIKRVEGWVAKKQESIALVAEEDAPTAIPLSWNLLYVPIILLTLVVAVVGYPSMPDLIPMHMDFQGNVNDWAEKSPKVLAFPLALEVFLAACFLFCHWSMKRSKRPTGLGSPATSAYAYGAFVRAQSIMMLAMGLLMTVACGLGCMAAMIGYISMVTATAIILVATVVVLIGAIGISVMYGQAGSRLHKRMMEEAERGLPESDEMLADDDKHWKFGIFYVNPSDPALFLPKRFGVGWTVNFGRPAVWALFIGLIVVSVAFSVGTMELVG